MIELQHIEILQRPAAHAASTRLPPGLRLVELDSGETDRACVPAPAEVAPRDRARVSARFRQGLRFFVLETDRGDAVAWTWLAAGVPRYLDELCWLIDMRPGQAWIRDCEVVPSRRGQRLLAGLIDAVVRRLGTPTELFVDIERSNPASLRAHRAAGFGRIALVRGMTLSQRLVLRQRPPAALPPVTALSPRRRLLRLDRDQLAWHRAHIA